MARPAPSAGVDIIAIIARMMNMIIMILLIAILLNIISSGGRGRVRSLPSRPHLYSGSKACACFDFMRPPPRARWPEGPKLKFTFIIGSMDLPNLNFANRHVSRTQRFNGPSTAAPPPWQCGQGGFAP